ncbi:hypothetical protein QJS04_geneDACA008618 [Acorus gramineus]|uniref:Uncharacterized protein n=2 Tax=Acorus TaxID=4464 RepID=A0AAV9DHZ3_ACOCL|nr:hypothetical protein QJS04_geneDACA008618 [Acorus gramineus]KAK1300642.1 hypothetical protein QJS10_CPB13g01446 [Acorus calamus]KAK1300644.1 hypothetical protein QJS10_CPB13g01444 [Acorus calamus]KAK1311080.1 hypothetical protein QJS10_CPA08g01349 [Acorus calamus]
MGHLRRSYAVLLCLLFLTFSHCDGIRSSQDLGVKSMMPGNSGLFYGFLPRSLPIPPSGPSKRINGVGLQNLQKRP